MSPRILICLLVIPITLYSPPPPPQARSLPPMRERLVRLAIPGTLYTSDTVVVTISVDPSGHIGRTEVTRASSYYDDRCLAAVRQWQFLPSRGPTGGSVRLYKARFCIVRREEFALSLED